MRSMYADRFWNALDHLVATHRILIDRKAGTSHPRYADVVYPLDYGYLEGTMAPDGGGVDVWVGSLGRAVITGVMCTVDLHKSDAEIKILIDCSEEEMKRIEMFHNERSMSGLLSVRPQRSPIDQTSEDG